MARIVTIKRMNTVLVANCSAQTTTAKTLLQYSTSNKNNDHSGVDCHYQLRGGFEEQNSHHRQWLGGRFILRDNKAG